MDSNELYHYGVLGMKWGIRRYQNKDGTLTAAGKKRLNAGNEQNLKQESSDKQSTRSKKSVKEMSDEELQKKINRLQMEKRYKDLATSDISAGKKFVKDVVYNAAKQTATKFVADAMTKSVDKLIKSLNKK